MTSQIGDLRSRLRFSLVKLVGPMASRILYALMEQLPQGYHIEGWFMPDHKAIMTENGNMTVPVYYHLVEKLIKAGLLERKRKQFNVKRGLWYKISFDRMYEILKEGDNGLSVGG
jgi:hypothetical protein